MSLHRFMYILLAVLIVVLVVGSPRGQRVYDVMNPFDNYATSSNKTSDSLLDRVTDGDDWAVSVDKKPSGGVSGSPVITSKDVEEKAEKVLETLKELDEDEKVDELHAPKSPYAGMIKLAAGKAKATDEEDEYVTLTASSDNSKDVYITGWTLESYVTESEGTIRLGARYLEEHNSRDDEPILLKPGELAYVTTGDTPLNVSFRENRCSGYLEEYGDFNPGLKKSCPLASDELLQHGEDDVLEDDECFDYIADIKKCELVDEDELDNAGLRSSCDAFILKVLDYKGCVDRHDDEPGFYDGGAWRIYLEEDRELWRTTGEIIRLLDKEGRVVDVVEY